MPALFDRSGHRRPALALLFATLVAGTLSACSSSSGSSSGGVSAAPVDISLLGPDNPAKGTPVKIGFVHAGRGAAIDTTDQGVAAPAIIAYANAKLGGLGGHPIELVRCETKSNPTTDCGDQMVSGKVLAVIGGQLGEAQQVRKSLAAQQIPYVDSNNAVLGSNIDVSLSNPLLAIGAPAQYAKDHGLKSVTLVVIDQAAAVAQIRSFAPLLFGKVGVAVNVIGIPVGTADMTPQIQAAESKHPAMYHLVGNDTFCASALKAIKTLGLTAKVTGINRCLSATSASSIPGGYAGLTAITGISTEPAATETKLYRAFLAKYLPGKSDSPDLQTAYQAVLGFVRGVNAGKLTSVTPAGVAGALKAMPESPLPLGGGLTYQCNRLKVSVMSGACATGAITAEADAKGYLHSFTVLDDARLYDLSGK